MMCKRGLLPILSCLFVLNLSAGAMAQHPEWVRKYSIPTSAVDSAGPVATDGAGNVYAALSSGYGWTTCKYDLAGELIWSSTTNARSGFAEPAVGLAADFTGRSFAVTVVSRRIDSNAHHTIVLKYSPEGARIGNARYDGDLVGANYTELTSTDESGLHYVVMTCAERFSAELQGSSTAIFTYRRDPLLRLGDANCDGRVNNFDVDAFVLGMIDIDAWQAVYPACPTSNLDMNGTGAADLFDIDPFVSLIITGRAD